MHLEPDDTGGGQDMDDIQLWTASPRKVFLQPVRTLRRAFAAAGEQVSR
ncbi:hypothetical protein ACFZBM_38665 [Streptomyces lavendulae]